MKKEYIKPFTWGMGVGMGVGGAIVLITIIFAAT